MHLRLRKCEKLPQTYCKLAVAEHLLQFCGCGLSVNLRCPALTIYLSVLCVHNDMIINFDVAFIPSSVAY